MYEVKENSRILKDGTEITTYIRDVVSCNILEVEAGTTGYCGGDTDHGGRTYFRIQDAACTDMEIHSYPTAAKPTQTPAADTSYKVQIDIANLNIRKGPGTNYGKTGQFTGKGIFTIVQESKGEGATLWGKLKSGAGWISLDFAKRI